jgi:hypothetical protein
MFGIVSWMDRMDSMEKAEIFVGALELTPYVQVSGQAQNGGSTNGSLDTAELPTK